MVNSSRKTFKTQVRAMSKQKGIIWRFTYFSLLIDRHFFLQDKYESKNENCLSS